MRGFFKMVGMVHLGNWVCDLYSRIDADSHITGNAYKQYRDEIHWCYRLGYMSQDDYYTTLEYLDTQLARSEQDSERAHEVRMAQIAHDQALVAAKSLEQEEICNLFLEHVRFDRRRGLYYYI